MPSTAKQHRGSLISVAQLDSLKTLQNWRKQLTVPQFTVITGPVVIVLGTLLMATPLCSTSSEDLWESLFTVTSAITVTGLSVINISSELTPLGQVLIAALMLTGGLGLMAITTFLQGFMQGRSGLRQRPITCQPSR
jgi:trk system potassium uptake protein TrkH